MDYEQMVEVMRSPEFQALTIRIEGYEKVGKSTLAGAINAFLTEHGIEVDWEDDWKPPADGDNNYLLHYMRGHQRRIRLLTARPSR